MVLDYITVRSGIDRGDRGLHRGNSRNEEKITRRRYFLAKLEEFNARGIRHTDVGNHDVENLGFELSARGLAIQGHLDAMSFLAKGDLQQFTNGALVIDDQNMSHTATPSP